MSSGRNWFRWIWLIEMHVGKFCRDVIVVERVIYFHFIVWKIVIWSVCLLFCTLTYQKIVKCGRINIYLFFLLLNESWNTTVSLSILVCVYAVRWRINHRISIEMATVQLICINGFIFYYLIINITPNIKKIIHAHCLC